MPSQSKFLEMKFSLPLIFIGLLTGCPALDTTAASSTQIPRLNSLIIAKERCEKLISYEHDWELYDIRFDESPIKEPFDLKEVMDPGAQLDNLSYGDYYQRLPSQTPFANLSSEIAFTLTTNQNPFKILWYPFNWNDQWYKVRSTRPAPMKVVSDVNIFASLHSKMLEDFALLISRMLNEILSSLR